MTNEEIANELKLILIKYKGTKNNEFCQISKNLLAELIAKAVEELLTKLEPQPKFKVNDFVIAEDKIYKITSCVFSNNDGEYVYGAMSVGPLTAVHQFKEKYIRSFGEFIKEYG